MPLAGALETWDLTFPDQFSMLSPNLRSVFSSDVPFEKRGQFRGSQPPFLQLAAEPSIVGEKGARIRTQRVDIDREQ